MAKFLLLTPNLGSTGYAKQSYLLAGGLAERAHQVTVMSTDGPGIFGPRLTRLGVRLLGSGGRRLIDLDDIAALRRSIVADRPDAIHVYGFSAFRYFRTATLGLRNKSVAPIVHWNGREQPSLLTRRLLRSAQCLVVPHAQAESDSQSWGLTRRRIRPMVASPHDDSARREWPIYATLPSNAFALAAVGRPVSNDYGFGAVWSYEILRRLASQLHTLMFGDHPNRIEFERKAYTLSYDDYRVRFAGLTAEPEKAVAAADAAIVTRKRGGTNAALEAMIAGRPLIMTDSSESRCLVTHRISGLVIPHGDAPAGSKAIRMLLHDEALRRTIGEGGRRVAREHLVETVLEDYRAIHPV